MSIGTNRDNSQHIDALKQSRFEVRMAIRENDEVVKSQRLRYKVFAEEMGASIDTEIPGVDYDKFDDHCEHLIVVDNKINEVVATTRLVTNETAEKVGEYYSATEFNIDNLISRDKRFLEIGRTCVHPDYRTSTAINHLWQGVAKTMLLRKVDYLFGCVSIPIVDQGEYITSLMSFLRQRRMSSEDMRVYPRVPVNYVDVPEQLDVVMPSLLKRYLNIGAVVCGEPSYDKAFNVADIFIVVDTKKINKRYERHFLYGA